MPAQHTVLCTSVSLAAGLVEKRRKVIADVLKLHLTPAQVAAAAAARKGGVAGSRAGDGEGGEAPGKVGSLEGKKAK
jgi:hypothetical protein